MKNIKLLRVHYLPKDFQSEILYVTEEFGVAGHLCPCGCGNKIITPLGPTEWSFWEDNGKPTLEPSIGNWQLPCRSHYWISKGIIEWSGQWTDKEIKESLRSEAKRRKAYYKKLNAKLKRPSAMLRFINWLFRK